MQAGIWQVLTAWAIAVLAYPGALFGVGLALTGEWLYSLLRPTFMPRHYRPHARHHPVAGPVYGFLKLLGRSEPAGMPLDDGSPRLSTGGLLVPGLLIMAAPVMALALMPLPGNPVQPLLGPIGDLLLVTVLLALGPVSLALLRASSGGLEALEGGREIGRLVTGLFPAVIALAAIIQVQGNSTMQISGLGAAPETGVEFFVRLLAGAALIIALPWWSPVGWPHDSAFAYGGAFLQRAALAAFWAVVALPAPGDPSWAIVVYLGGSLFAYVATRLLSERWAPALRQDEAARRVWITAVPAALVAVLAALWLGG